MPEIVDFSVEVDFGGVSGGDQTARVGIKIARERLGLSQADQMLCGKRLSVLIRRGPAGGEAPEQMHIPGTEDAFEQISGAADVKGYRVSPKEIGFGLTFSLGEIDGGSLMHFAKRKGRLTIATVEALPDEESDDDDDPTYEDHEDVGPQPKSRKRKSKTQPLPLGNDRGSALPVSELAKFGLSENECEKLGAAMQLKGVGVTIGELERWMASNEYWHRDIKGFGESKLGKLQDAHLRLRQQYPPETDEDRDRAARAEEAYRLGCEAAQSTEAEASGNPYPEGSPERPAWLKGFEDMRNEPDAQTEAEDDDPAGATERNRAKEFGGNGE